MRAQSESSGLSVIRTLRESLALLATRRFATFWFASLLSSVGTWTQQVAEPWLLLTIGASPFLIGLDSFAMNAPTWLFTLVGGALADRSDRRRVIAFFQSIQMLCPAAIVLLMVTHAVRPWMIIVLSVVVGVTDALSMPSFQSIVPSIVSREQIGRGLALNSVQFNLSRILGPSIAGVLMSSVGAMACFVVSVLSYVPFIGVALWVLPRWAPGPSGTGASRGAPAGIGEILRQPLLRTALLTVLTTAVFCAPIVTFIPILIRTVFRADAGHFSIAVAAFGGGGLLGAATLLGVAPSVDRRWLSSGFAIAYACVVTLAGLDRWLWAIPLLLLVAGASVTLSNTAANSLLQSMARPHLLGQTVSLYMLAIRGGMSVGALLTGITVSRWGVQGALIVNGLVGLAVQATLARAWARHPLPGSATE